MNFDDNGNDYFLHNFKEGQDKDQSRQQSSENPAQSTADANRTPAPNGFTFPETNSEASQSNNSNNGASNNTAPQTPAPAGKKRKRHGWRWFFFILFVVLGVAVYIRYFVPYATESRTTGYITRVEKRGIIFKTFEGEMISQSQLTDTTRVYSRDFFFSIPNDSLARVIQSYEGTGRPVTLTSKRYFGTLPWRGASTTVVTAIDN